MPEADRQSYIFEISGGSLCLDFANTVSRRSPTDRREHLNDYRDLVAWGEQGGIFSGREAHRLTEEADQRPAEAAAVLERAIALREVIFRVFAAIAAGQSPAASDLAALNEALPAALARLRLVPTADGYTWDWQEDPSALDRMLWPVIRSAADLLTSGQLTTVRECAAEWCRWLFLDTSRAQRRQWCDMKVCGNRAKARRHYEREKRAKSTAASS